MHRSSPDGLEVSSVQPYGAKRARNRNEQQGVGADGVNVRHNLLGLGGASAGISLSLLQRMFSPQALQRGIVESGRLLDHSPGRAGGHLGARMFSCVAMRPMSKGKDHHAAYKRARCSCSWTISVLSNVPHVGAARSLLLSDTPQALLRASFLLFPVSKSAGDIVAILGASVWGSGVGWTSRSPRSSALACA